MSSAAATSPTGRVSPARLARGAITLGGAALVVSPYVWLPAWRDNGFSLSYAWFHVWTWLPFALLASLAGRGLRWPVAAALLAIAGTGTVVSVELTQSDADDALAWAVALPALEMLVAVAAWQHATHRRRAGAGASTPLVLAVAALAAAAMITVRLAGAPDGGRVQTFLVIATSIVVEALPFVMLGAAVSAALEVYVPDRWLDPIARLPLRLQVPAVALAGVAMPVCECGSVPVARRLILRGVHPSAGIAFMLAAPIINPVVLLSTFVAYHGRGAAAMVAGRASLGLVVALAAGTLLGRRVDRGRFRSGHADHGHQHAGGARDFADHLTADLLLMGKYIVLGATLAALMQTAVPQHVFTGTLTTPLVGSLLLVVLAFVLSLCSEADAFVAVSLIQFSPGPQLAFLAAGPMLDTKLAMLYGGTFGRGFVLRVAAIVVPAVVAGSMVFDATLR